MSDYYTPMTGGSSYTSSYYTPAPATTTTTYTSTPITTTTVLGSGTETAYGTNTAVGYFGGGQANVVTTPEYPVSGGYGTYDYGTDFTDYEEPKKKSLFSIRNILLGCLGLLLLAGLLAGLAGLFYWLKKRRATRVPTAFVQQPFIQQPVVPLPQVVVPQRPVIPPFPVIQPRPVGLYEPIRPQVNIINPAPIFQPRPVITQPVITKPIITQPVITQPIITQPVITQPVITQPVITQPIITQPVITQAQVVPSLSASDIQQLIYITSSQGPLTPASLAQLGLSEAQYAEMLRGAYSSGVLSAEQASFLGLSPQTGVFGAISNAASKVGNAFNGAFDWVKGKAVPTGAL